MTTAYPLHWPDHWPRSKRPGSSQFRTTLPKALDNVHGSISRFADDSGKKVENIVISSNFSLSERRPKDAGVACYFLWDGIQTCIAVDRYAKLEDNLQAIHHCIEAERTKLRHGGINLVRAAFRGYAALPPPDEVGPGWREIFDIGDDVPLAECELLIRGKLSKAHPDNGGDAHQFARLNQAYQLYKRERAA